MRYIVRWQSSNLSQRAYNKENNLRVGEFNYWVLGRFEDQIATKVGNPLLYLVSMIPKSKSNTPVFNERTKIISPVL